MQTVDILSAQKPSIVELTLELGEREMRGVRLDPNELRPLMPAPVSTNTGVPRETVKGSNAE